MDKDIIFEDFFLVICLTDETLQSVYTGGKYTKVPVPKNQIPEKNRFTSGKSSFLHCANFYVDFLVCEVRDKEHY